MFCRRRRLTFLAASIFRRLAWMLETGNYELEQSLVIGRYGSQCSQERVEAIAILNEFPHRAADITLVVLVFTGTYYRDQGRLMTDFMRQYYRPRFLQSLRHVEQMSLMDAEYMRDHGVLPPNRALRTIDWGDMAVGVGIVVDYGYSRDLDASRDGMEYLNSFRINVKNLLNIHTHGLGSRIPRVCFRPVAQHSTPYASSL